MSQRKTTTHFLREDNEAEDAKNDVLNWIRGCKKFNEIEVKRFIRLLEDFEQAQYSAGYANCGFDIQENS